MGPRGPAARRTPPVTRTSMDLMTAVQPARGTMHAGRPQGDHQRLLLMALVEADPGIHLMRATHLLSLHWNTCYHHARRLALEGRLVMRKVQGRLCLFDPRQGGLERRLGPLLLRDARTAQLASAILAHPGTNQKQLGRIVGVAPSIVHRHVVRLERAGLVQRVRRSRALAVFPAESLAAALPAPERSPVGALVPGDVIPAA